MTCGHSWIFCCISCLKAAIVCFDDIMLDELILVSYVVAQI